MDCGGAGSLALQTLEPQERGSSVISSWQVQGTGSPSEAVSCVVGQESDV